MRRKPPDINDFFRIQSSLSPGGYAFEALQKNLDLLNGVTKRHKTYLVVSAIPEEGKTTVVANLAVAMMLAGKRVLVIDGDLRRPGVHRVFDVANESGWVDVVSRARDWDSVVQEKRLVSEDLCDAYSLFVIPSGKISQSKVRLVNPDLIRDALNHYKENFDVVLMDSPPVLAAREALIYAPLVTGAIMVLNSGVVAEKEARQVKDQLEEVGGKILGVVMNRFKKGVHGSGVQPYYDYYQKPEK